MKSVGGNSMAAIAGCLSFSGASPDRQEVSRSLDYLFPRGGGKRDFFLSRNFVLGISHNETYAKGLVHGNDPDVFVALDGILFNLDELTHQFGISPQIPPLPQLYKLLGEQFIPKLNGQYALVVWDRVRNVLLLARDPV